MSDSPKIATSGLISCNFELFWRSSSLDTLQECRLPESAIACHLPHPDIPALRHFTWHPEGDKHSMISLPSSELTWHMVRTPAMAMVVTVEQLCTLFSDSELDWFFGNADKIKRRDLDGAALFSVAAAIHRMLLAGLRETATVDVVQFNYCMGQVVLDWMEVLMCADSGKTKSSNRERILTRSLDYIRHHYRFDIKIRDLVDYTHSTSRNLQLVFKNQFGLTPLQFLRCYRLIKFHKALRQVGSVTEAAVASGLRHMGRLPDHYRAMFGENPTDYLSRMRGRDWHKRAECHCGHCRTGQ